MPLLNAKQRLWVKQRPNFVQLLLFICLAITKRYSIKSLSVHPLPT